MQFIRLTNPTAREIKREVNTKILRVPETQQNVYDDEPVGHHTSDLANIAQATNKFTDCQIIMSVIWTRLADSGSNWRLAYKALLAIEYLVAHGSKTAVDDIIDHSFQISSLSTFEYVELNGKYIMRVEAIMSLLDDKDKIQETRGKSAVDRDKYFGLSLTGSTRVSSSISKGGKYDIQILYLIDIAKIHLNLSSNPFGSSSIQPDLNCNMVHLHIYGVKLVDVGASIEPFSTQVSDFAVLFGSKLDAEVLSMPMDLFVAKTMITKASLVFQGFIDITENQLVLLKSFHVRPTSIVLDVDVERSSALGDSTTVYLFVPVVGGNCIDWGLVETIIGTDSWENSLQRARLDVYLGINELTLGGDRREYGYGKLCHDMAFGQKSRPTYGIDRPHAHLSVVMAEYASRYYMDYSCERSFGLVQDVRIPCQQKRLFGFVTLLYPDTVKMSPHFVCGAQALVNTCLEKSKLVYRKFSDKLEHPMYFSNFLDMDHELQGKISLPVEGTLIIGSKLNVGVVVSCDSRVGIQNLDTGDFYIVTEPLEGVNGVEQEARYKKSFVNDDFVAVLAGPLYDATSILTSLEADARQRRQIGSAVGIEFLSTRLKEKMDALYAEKGSDMIGTRFILIGFDDRRNVSMKGGGDSRGDADAILEKKWSRTLLPCDMFTVHHQAMLAVGRKEKCVGGNHRMITVKDEAGVLKASFLDFTIGGPLVSSCLNWLLSPSFFSCKWGKQDMWRTFHNHCGVCIYSL